MLLVAPHPRLRLGAFRAELPCPLGGMGSPAWLLALLSRDAQAPLRSTDSIRQTIRDLLRHGGYKPTGRGKPASEYLIRAADEGKLGSINPMVDACNVVSLHSGLPISLVDRERAEAPLRVGIANGDVSYVFNATGQEIRVQGLLCLHDRQGPCANAVKDSERTKTRADTRQVLALVWGERTLAEHTDRTVAWYREIVERLGAPTTPVAQEEPPCA